MPERKKTIRAQSACSHPIRILAPDAICYFSLVSYYFPQVDFPIDFVFIGNFNDDKVSNCLYFITSPQFLFFGILQQGRGGYLLHYI